MKKLRFLILQSPCHNSAIGKKNFQKYLQIILNSLYYNRLTFYLYLTGKIEIILISLTGRSLAPVATEAILSTTSSPLTVSPNTV